MNTNGNNYSDRLVADDELGGGVEGIWMDYDKKELFGTQEEIKTKVRVLCNSGITYGNFAKRKPIKQYKMLKNYY